MADFIAYPHPIFTIRADYSPVNSALVAIGQRLRKAQLAASSYGLAGAHIGENAPVMVLNLATDNSGRHDVLYFNPVIKARSENQVLGAEASVSMPGIEVQILRPEWIEFEFEDAQGRLQMARLDGFAARCAAHEIDQINGVFFLQRLSRLKRDMALKRYSKSLRAG